MVGNTYIAIKCLIFLYEQSHKTREGSDKEQNQIFSVKKLWIAKRL